MHLKSRDVGIPGGWHDVCPHCGNHSVGITFGQLFGRVAIHYQNMNHPIQGSLENEIEERLCAGMWPQRQTAFCKTGIPPRSAVPWGEVAAFIAWLTGWLLGGK